MPIIIRINDPWEIYLHKINLARQERLTILLKLGLFGIGKVCDDVLVWNGRGFSRVETCQYTVTKYVSDHNGETHCLCDSCFDALPKCSHCGSAIYDIETRDGEVANNKYYCWRCIKALNFQECSLCREYSQDYQTINGEIYYSDCLNHEEVGRCSRCNAFSQARMFTYDTNEYLCPHCGEQAVYCSQCHSLYVNYCACVLNLDTVKRWAFKLPQSKLVFHKLDNERTKTYYGIELKVELGNSKVKQPEVIEITREYFSDKEVYFKNDGSLEQGIELVFMPRTLKSWDETIDNLNDLTFELKEKGVLSHQTATCGLHIHMSKTGFEDVEEKAQDWLETLAVQDGDSLLSMARRKYHHLVRHASPYVSGLTNKLDKYVALRIGLPDTIELRIFQGTLRAENILAAIHIYQTIMLCVISDIKPSFSNLHNYGDEVVKKYLEYQNIIIDQEATMHRLVGLQRKP